MKRFVLLIFGICFSLHISAQQNTLSLVPGSFLVRNLDTGMSGSDSLFTSNGDSLQIEARVVFTGPGVITDHIGFGIANDSLMGTGSDTLFQRAFPLDTISSGDTLLVSVIDVVDSLKARYSGGTGGGAIVVVVWPVLRINPFVIEQGAQILLDFTAQTSVPGPFGSGFYSLSCFPNPCKNTLHMRWKETSPKFEYVRIRDLQGRLFFSGDLLPQSLDVQHWPGGVYILELYHKQAAQHYVKIVKQ